MGWKSIAKNGEVRWEGHPDPELGGRPVAQGEEGNLHVIIQEDYGHTVVVDLNAGVIIVDPLNGVNVQNGTLEFEAPKLIFWVCDETNIVGEMAHLKQELVIKRDEKGRKVRDETGKLIEVRNDVLTPLTFRPIWFSRVISTLPAPVKVIGLQTTLPEIQGGHNYKKMVMLFPDGRIGID